ncbi:probable oxidoreductase, short chain dehydrogenase/reductase family superfamily [Ramularia collo-cygni]|uniref:Probable oxidoreductase, short chain dehydrogenase/reductase family superfamily n=1 Tax=Ramularia collo-cygni TaxID=112498 RepID=A0A2D3UMF1_9PEZI|nr:probable oxidoreductase, short chain dehydrogenase/reductase family superfamily [Ramularia collo-cygni]CZT15241.1 probable oxidoreductase, short chain dehydrogenase/reductase family superfamily [Ramularia collo-cygni]
MPSVLIVGATRGLGLELVKQYAAKNYTVSGTARSNPAKDAPDSIHWISGVDVAEETAGRKIAEGLKGQKQDIVIISAGYFGKESFDEPDFEAEVTMYKTSAIGPVFIVHALEKAGLLGKGSKVILVSSEAGSITLRHESEGGGMYGHHASKAALNMVGKLLSFDLKEKGVAVGLVHPAFMRTEMTKGVGFDKFWDVGGAVTPDVSAGSLVEWIEGFDISSTGEYWAPRGAGDIGTAEPALGKKKSELPTPLQLPW